MQIIGVHKSSVVSEEAKIASDVVIGPFSVVERDVDIAEKTIIHSGALIASGARVGSNCSIFHGAVLATVPQDIKFGGEDSLLIVGDNCIIREFATLNRGTRHGGGVTRVGSNCMLMAYSHIAHDCQLGNNVIIANAVNMGGHVEINDFVSVGGMTVIHQFVKIGAYAFIGGKARISQDVPPYILTTGEEAKYYGPNAIGLRRRGFSSEQIETIKRTYNYIYRSKLNLKQAVSAIRSEMEVIDEVAVILDFIEKSERGLAGK